MKKTKGNLERGITLVALIITIIVMLILVGVTVAVVVDSDIIGQAEKAGNLYKDAHNKELKGNVTINDEEYSSLTEYLQSKCEHTDLDENLKCINCNIQLIEFAIEGTLYYAEEGMTWYDWCSSRFNTVGWSCLPNSWVSMFDEYGGRSIVLRGRYEDSSDYVQGSDALVANKDYNRSYDGPMDMD